NTTVFSIKYTAVAFIAGNKSLKEVEGPFDDNISVRVRVEIFNESVGIDNITINTTWGDEGVAWWHENTSGQGEYIIFFNTSSVYCSEGDNKSVNITFSRDDISPATLSLFIHPWARANLMVFPFNNVLHVNETTFICVNYTSESGADLKASGSEFMFINYSINNYLKSQLNFNVSFNETNCTFRIELNTTKIPSFSKVNNWTFMLDVQTKLDNGTYYESKQHETTITIIPLSLNAQILRFDTTFNSSLANNSVEEFEKVATKVPFWIEVKKQSYSLNGNYNWIYSSGLNVELTLNDSIMALSEDINQDGIYKGLIDLSDLSPGDHELEVIINGNDVAPINFTISITILSRYKIQVNFTSKIEKFTEGRTCSFSVILLYKDLNNKINLLTNKKVRIDFDIYDGMVHDTWSFNYTTDELGMIEVKDIYLPKIRGESFLSFSISIIGDYKDFDTDYKASVSIPIVESFWDRQGISVVLLIISCIAATIFMYKKGIPLLIQNIKDKKLKLLRTRMADAPSIDAEPFKIKKKQDNLLEDQDISLDKSYVLMHMEPDELPGLDLSLKAGKNANSKSLNFVASKSVMESLQKDTKQDQTRSHPARNKAPDTKRTIPTTPIEKDKKSVKKASDGVKTSWDIYKTELEHALKRGKEWEEKKNFEKAKEYYNRALIFAKKLKNEDIISKLDNYIKKLDIKKYWDH
ncbi:MAG: hypothetical protein ACTSYS_11035, partial [Promethearchaeota archaeon]